ncbi:MAG: HD domain-containing protein [Deltaproteobacteria bacterium]|nr:HD domain-containing protein [Deltaproteobacteria bacterium]
MSVDLQTFLPELKNRFEQYVKQFASPDPDVQAVLDLKQAHTRRVCEAILDIGGHEGLSGEELRMAEAAALLHDIGRFEQYRKYKTFSDIRSENHALLGVKVIGENRILEGIDPGKAKVIIRAVECHNRAALPVGENSRGLLFMKLLRDADKVDIWRVVTDYYRNAHRERNQTIELNLPDEPEISDSVCRSLMKGNIVQMTDIRTLNDFKLLQIGWIYDVNFRRTFQIVKEKGYLGQIRGALPENSIRIAEVYERALAFLNLKRRF